MDDRVDLRPLKAAACRVLAPNHPMRVALLQEADFLGRDSALAKLEAYLFMATAL